MPASATFGIGGLMLLDDEQYNVDDEQYNVARDGAGWPQFLMSGLGRLDCDQLSPSQLRPPTL